jgi:hypothetical protein
MHHLGYTQERLLKISKSSCELKKERVASVETFSM